MLLLTVAFFLTGAIMLRRETLLGRSMAGAFAMLAIVYVWATANRLYPSSDFVTNFGVYVFIRVGLTIAAGSAIVQMVRSRGGPRKGGARQPDGRCADKYEKGGKDA